MYCYLLITVLFSTQTTVNVLLSHPVLLVGKQSGTVTLGNRSAIAYEVEHKFTLKPSNPTPRCLPKRNKTYVHIKASM